MQVIEITNLTKMSFNVYNSLHWAKKEEFKNNLKMLTASAVKSKPIGNYNLDFVFYFKGRRLDRINCCHFAKTIEDYLFKDDKDNGWIKLDTKKGTENKCILRLTKI